MLSASTPWKLVECYESLRNLDGQVENGFYFHGAAGDPVYV
jgi:hypothetical protein